MGTADPKLETNLGEPFDGAYDSHSIMVGYRIRFGGPRKRIRVAEAPAPKAEPRPTRRLLLNKLKRTPVVPVEEEEEAPLPQKAYLLFFDFDSSKVKGEAVGVVEAAANTALARKASSLTVTGYTDTAGPRPYNKRLSMRRADAVLNALAGWGVSAEDIHTVARGETDLLVSTGDGVREPKNRRVEIVIP